MASAWLYQRLYRDGAGLADRWRKLGHVARLQRAPRVSPLASVRGVTVTDRRRGTPLAGQWRYIDQ